MDVGGHAAKLRAARAVAEREPAMLVRATFSPNGSACAQFVAINNIEIQVDEGDGEGETGGSRTSLSGSSRGFSSRRGKTAARSSK